MSLWDTAKDVITQQSNKFSVPVHYNGMEKSSWHIIQNFSFWDSHLKKKKNVCGLKLDEGKWLKKQNRK